MEPIGHVPIQRQAVVVCDPPTQIPKFLQMPEWVPGEENPPRHQKHTRILGRVIGLSKVLNIMYSPREEPKAPGAISRSKQRPRPSGQELGAFRSEPYRVQRPLKTLKRGEEVKSTPVDVP